jgi:uncharacterized caspase-like protein
MKIAGTLHRMAFAIALGGSILTGCSLPNPPSNRYAVVIGIGDYQYVNGLGTAPGYDATAMRDLLKLKGWKVNSTLTDRQATKAGITAAIGGLVALADSEASILVYYSGHGISLSGIAYIAPSDTPSNFSTSDLISCADMSAWLSSIHCSNKILILDSCYSGGFVDSSASIDSAPQNYGSPISPSPGYPGDGGYDRGLLPTALANAGNLLAAAFASQSNPSVLTVAAAGSLEQSYNDGSAPVNGFGSGHGVFTYFLLDAATNGDANHDGLVTTQEAFAWAKRNVQDRWNMLIGGNYDYNGGNMYEDFLPRISGGSGDVVLFDNR